MCTKIYNALRNSEFGPAEKETEEYREHCRKIFPLATVFKSAQELSTGNGNSVKSTDSKFLMENCQENCKENFQENRQEISVSN